MLRMLLGPESSPSVLPPMVVLKLRNVTWFSALVASKRRSMLLRSVTRKVRPSEPFRLNCEGPVVVERTPPTVGVNGIPLPTLMALVSVQSFSTVPFHPWINMPPPRPTAVLYCQLRFTTLGRLLLERARSADVSR